MAPVQLAHTLAPPVAAQAAVAGRSAGPGGGSQAEEDQGEQEAHRDSLGSGLGV